MAQYDIVVIGAGVAGLSAGYFLSGAANVVVLEQESQPAYHASGRSAALYIEGYENETVSELTKAGKSFLTEPPADLCGQPLLHARGGLTAGPDKDTHEVRAFVERWAPHCPNLREISVEEALSLVPAFDPQWLAAACYDPDWLGIDVHELLQVYQRGIRANGGEVRVKAPVTALSRQGGAWRVDCGDSLLTADVVVNAAGAWAQQVGEMAGLDGIHLQPLRRTAVLLPLPEGGERWPLVHAADGSLYFKPEGSGLMVSPADEVPSVPMDAWRDDMDVALTIDRCQRAVRGDVKRVISTWAGLRTFAPDRRPVVGFDPRASGFYWLAGQGGFGVQTSAGLGDLVARNIRAGDALLPEIEARRFL